MWTRRDAPHSPPHATWQRPSRAPDPIDPAAPYYAQEHLPGALNLVAHEVESRAQQLLPDKHAPIVTYCSNAACANSGQVATKLERLGYTNVRKYTDGIQDWVEAALPTEHGIPQTPTTTSR